MKKLLILDSNSILNRAFYGVRPLSAPDGTPTNAVYGFLNILIKLINEQEPDYICAAFDLKAPTFRHKMYDGYKAQRKGMPDDLAAQLPVIKEILNQVNITILEKEGYEADDIIGTVAAICGENGISCYIATGDKDDLQLADERTRVILTVTKSGYNETIIYDPDSVKEKYRVTPKEFIDLKALMGDPSDNIPGVKGVGEKTAMSLIEKFGSIEYIYDHLEETGLKGKMLEKIINGKDMAFLSKKLAAIDTHVPIDFSAEECVFHGISHDAAPELHDTLKRLGLNSIIKKLELNPSSQIKDYDIMKEVRIRKNTVPEISEGQISIVLSFTGNELTGAAAAAGKEIFTIEGSDTADRIKPLLENERVKKITFDIKDAIVKLSGKINIAGICDDAAIAAYLTDPSKNEYTIPGLAMQYLGLEIQNTAKGQLSLLDDDMSGDSEYLAKCAAALRELNKILLEKLEKNEQTELYREMELPLINVLADMQINGFLVDSDELKAFAGMLSAKIDALTKEIYFLAGEEFNINSPKQLGVILFEKLKLRPVKKTKTGYSTNIDALEKIKDKHPIAGLLMQYRQYTKLKSTYCDSMGALINPQTHRIHSVFNQTVTVTGRISSADPNLQNIPTRTELGREIRKMFIAKEGCVLVDADYSQIELRVLAHMANDETMLRAFRNNEDIHAVTASQVLGIPLSEVTKEQRSSAKAVNFGIVYGIGEFSLSQDLKISVKDAKAYIDGYLEKYHGVREYMESVKEAARRDGYVRTMMNRIRYIPELKSKNFNLRSFGERAAMNTPIQGSAADIIKLAMVRVYNRLAEEGLRSKLILQVHDELIVEAYEEEAEEVKNILKNEMENVVKLSVPLVVDMSEGHSWYEAK